MITKRKVSSKNDMKKTHGTIPLYIMDEHNEAFYWWHRAHLEGSFDEPYDLFHIDAHDDMGRPESFRKSLYFPEDSLVRNPEYYRDFAATELDHGNFIIPAVLGRLVRNVYFIYPKWRKFKPQRKRYNVSSVFGEGKILKYGMKAVDKTDKRFLNALPDLVFYSYSMLDMNKIPCNKKVILDIDLDYFACRDSILNHFRYALAITPEQYRNRDAWLSDKTLAFAGLSFEFSEKNGQYFVHVAHKKGKEISHMPAMDEIVSEISAMIDILHSKKIRPMVVTIARSCISGYCPRDYMDEIEKELTRKLDKFLTG